MNTGTEPRPAATVVLIRDGAAGLESLMLKRNKALAFAGGHWVFPGGSLDPEDWHNAGNDEEAAARVGAAREALEESALVVDPDTMVQISHWTTPEAEPKRFYTWFFVARAPEHSEVEIDGSEIHDHAWLNVADAVRQHEAGELGLFPPTIMTLRCLLGYMSAEDAMIGLAARLPVRVLPVFSRSEDGVAVLFEGDAGYESGESEQTGARHRCKMQDGAWYYQYSEVSPEHARLDGSSG